MSQSMFKTRKTSNAIPRTAPRGGINTREYNDVNLDDAGADEEWTGQPFIADIYQGTSKRTGKPYFVAFFNIMDHDNQEMLKGTIFLQSKEDEVKFLQDSVGFDIIDSIDACNDYHGNGDEITIGFKEFQEVVNSIDKVTGIVKERTSERTQKYWNTFRITKIHPNEGFEGYGQDD